jgi:hypothetical protein
MDRPIQRLTSGAKHHFFGYYDKCPWVLYDFRSQLRQESHERGYNRKGLIADDHRSRKIAFRTVREVHLYCLRRVT